LRAVIFANGHLGDSAAVLHSLLPGDLIIAADGGARHCRALGIPPDVLIGDFDSLAEVELASLQADGIEIVRHPADKDYTDLELALRHALQLGAEEAVVYAALGVRWDQTLANLLLPACTELEGLRIRLVDGPQEIHLLRADSERPELARLEIYGQAGDTVSLIPLTGDAHGITTRGLQYPLQSGSLAFGATRGVSNAMVGAQASVELDHGLLLLVVIHAPRALEDSR